MISNIRRRRFAVLGVLTAMLLSLSSAVAAQESVTATIEVAEVAISVANANVDFGTVNLGGVGTTKNGAVAPTVTNEGNVDLDQLVIGYDHAASGPNATCTTGSWSAVSAPPPGTDEFFMAAYTWEDSAVVIPTGEGTGVDVLGGGGGTTLAPGATFDIDLDFGVPTEITTSGPCTTDLEVFGIAS